MKGPRKSTGTKPKAETVKTVPGHDSRGRFDGTIPGPGRPALRPKRFLRLVRSMLSADDLQAIVAKTIALAVQGDTEARRWLSSMMLHQPKPEPPPPMRYGPDGQPTDASVRRLLKQARQLMPDLSTSPPEN